MTDDIFDLEAVNDLIIDKQPPAVIVVDTSIVINNPDFNKWGTSLGEVIFVLPALINIQLAIIRRRNQSKKDPRPVGKAVRAYSELCKKGMIHRGIHLDGVGWFISVPMPMEDRVAPALKQWRMAARAYGSMDVMFLPRVDWRLPRGVECSIRESKHRCNEGV